MLLPNGCNSGTRPGLPSSGAAAADNDLVVAEAISNSKFWKETSISLMEDAPHAGLDHVDGHRTIEMVINPYTKGRMLCQPIFKDKYVPYYEKYSGLKSQ